MGVWEWIYSVTNAVKQKTPDVTPVAEICRQSYDYCRDTTVHVAGTATAKAREVHGYLSDDQVRDNLGRVAVNVSKNSALYLARSYGGGPVIDIFSRSVQDKKADSHKGRIEELETRVASLEKELSSKRIAQQLKIQRVITESESQDESNFNANMNEKPEDVLKIFMMQQYVGKNLFDNLIIPTGVGSEKKEKVVSNIQGHQCE
ncbi:hypothetical protein SOVF_028290 [Spinacia oleracea]|uniref:Uncharacterized protein isoform X1 n=1 Tax=Spinacia oleracea TaxID=3562 RepID=A0A9R0KC02_SPIOL|nr:uncharacterized protein LOC110804972 isoform X1 [Spinacia oleracea]KNA23047.1 hypothetical protein SOVF_028290 [Spinacia oleracea]